LRPKASGVARNRQRQGNDGWKRPQRLCGHPGGFPGRFPSAAERPGTETGSVRLAEAIRQDDGEDCPLCNFRVSRAIEALPCTAFR
jgi:hypothetical protein